MSLRMESLEFFGGLIKLNLGGLSFGNFSFKLVGFSCNFDSKLFNLKGKLLDFGLICSSIFLKGEVILFLLSGSKGPLLELLLIPIHLKLELIHLLVSLEDHVLDIVKSILLISDTVIKFFNFILQSTRLPLGNLLHVLLSFDFLVFGIDKRLCMNKLHLHRFEMLS